MSYIYRKSTIERIKKKCDLLGKKYSVIKLLNLRLISSLLLFCVLLFVINTGLIVAPLISFVYYYLVEIIFFDIVIYKRRYRLEKEGKVILNLILLSIKNNNSFLSSVSLVSDFEDNELSYEFELLLENIKKGKSLDEALNIMKKRIPSDCINNIISSLSINDLDNLNKIFIKYNSDIKKRISLIKCVIFVINIIFVLSVMAILVGIIKY